jgi:Mrp family chromosome partitioning ATPase
MMRTYHEVAGEDASQLAAQVAAQRSRVKERLRGIGSVIAIMSGKGGVGRVTSPASLRAGWRWPGIGVLDAV